MSRVVVYHSFYGCDTGCCGHTVELDGFGRFEFSHPGLDEPARDFAEELVRDAFGEDHVSDLDWDSCFVIDD